MLNLTLPILVSGSSVNLESLRSGTDTHPVLVPCTVQPCLRGAEECCVSDKQSDCIRNINRANFKVVHLHIESIPTSIRLDGLTKVTLLLRFLMVSQIPRSGSGSPCEATSNSLCHGISLCALKQQICVSLKCFRCELFCSPRGEDGVAYRNTRRETIAERKGRACAEGWSLADGQ